VIYLDHHAATPVCSAALQAMEAARAESWANPSSVHAAGRRARGFLDRAREQVAGCMGASEGDVVLTAGGTEACNLGVLGLARNVAHVITTEIEHPAVSQAVERLRARGARVTRLSVWDGKAPDASDVASRIGDEPTLLAVQWINHETGTLLPIDAWAHAARQRGAHVFVDATQALGKIPVDVSTLEVDALALASHKIGGPAGAGALWIRRGVTLDSVLVGGAQERGRRAGTPDVTTAVGFGAACAQLPQRLDAMDAIAARRDRLEQCLRAHDAVVNGAAGPRASTVVNVSVPGWQGEVLVAALDVEGVCASSGAACSSGVSGPSAVLRAMYPEQSWRAQSALRLSLGPEVDDGSADQAKATIAQVLARGPMG
jgi:cysteine desulfurase